MRLTEPSADLAVALAVASAQRDTPLPPGLVILGELSLTGEIRRVTSEQRRLAEAARLGCRVALVPQVSDSPQTVGNMRVATAHTLGDALALLRD
jgi:DNA repair protein RadA/Sms